MGKLILILGGARSGKSTYAEKLASSLGAHATYIATAQALDAEMEERIANHRRNRPETWQTREIPFEVGKKLLETPPGPGVVLLDCLTLLVSNLLMQISDPEGEIEAQAAALLVENEINYLLKAVQNLPNDWLIVSNEVGMGLVPPYPLGRAYRDLLGWANQRLASQADQVVFMIAGIPMRLTPLAT